MFRIKLSMVENMYKHILDAFIRIFDILLGVSRPPGVNRKFKAGNEDVGH